MVLPEIERHGPIDAWIIDDTGLPKKGRHSVGVARQYCGQLGKQDNCQIAVTLSLANHHASLAAAYRLYICQRSGDGPYTSAQSRCAQGSPSRPSRQLLSIICAGSCAAGLPRGVVLMDAGYGTDTALREKYHRTWPELCGWHPATNVGMGA